MSNLVTKNNSRVKLADGLTPFGMSQVKKEIGSGGGSDLRVTKIYTRVCKNYVTEYDEYEYQYCILNPNTKDPYYWYEGKDELNPRQTPTDEEIQAFLEQCYSDYHIVEDNLLSMLLVDTDLIIVEEELIETEDGENPIVYNYTFTNINYGEPSGLLEYYDNDTESDNPVHRERGLTLPGFSFSNDASGSGTVDFSIFYFHQQLPK